MKEQVDWVQVLHVALDRRAVLARDMLDGTFNRLFGANVRANVLTESRLQEIVIAYGAKFTEIDGDRYIIKNNSRRERVVEDKRAMAWFVRNVMPGSLEWTYKMVRSASYQDGINWKALCRVAKEMGWYLVGEYETASWRDDWVLQPAGQEMDYDQRIRITRTMRDAWSTGVTLESDLMWQIVLSREPLGISERDYDLCIALTKSGFHA